jgi:arginine N-succinyltransferase
MMLLRNARKSDLDTIYQFAEQSGVGFTTLPKDKEILANRLSWSCTSFQKTVDTPNGEYYLFVLEDPSTGQVVGTSAIEATTGFDFPFYSYKVSKHTRICSSLNIRSDYEALNLVNDNQGRSEICTLFVEPAYRFQYNGLLLSRGRFLFMGQYPERFTSIIIAELRGISDEREHSPFWDGLGEHFFHIPFVVADHLTLSENKQFIADLMPTYPIYVNILPPAAQGVIGIPHESTMKAMNILLREGFRYNSYIDIFDGGPTLEAPREQIRTIANNRLMTVKNTRKEVSSQQYIIANTKLNYRATISQATINKSQNSCIISKETAQLLEVELGDTVRIVPLLEDPTFSSEH